MATFYKYAERDANSRIDWAEVGSNMSEMVREEGRIRQAKKDELLQQSRDFNEFAVNPPMGEHQGFNQFTTDYAANAQEYALMVENLVRSGDINLREYTNIRANLKQGTEEAFSIAEEYNTHFKQAMERGEIDPETGFPTSQEYEQWVLGTVQGFGNYANHRLWINPVDGVVNLGTMEKNEETGLMEMSTETGSSQPVNGLRNWVRAQYDYYNVGTSTAGMVNQLGQTIKVIMRDGVETRESALQNPDFQEALTNFVESQTAIPTNVSSILTNSLGINPETGEPYDFTDNPNLAAADPNLILSIANPMQPNSGLPMPAFGVDLKKILKDAGLSEEEMKQVIANNEGQMKAADEALRVSILTKLDEIEDPMPVFNNEKERREAGRGVEKTALAITNMADIYAAETQGELDAALGFVQGLDPSISRVYIDPDNTDNVLVERRDKDGNIVVMEPFVKGDSVEDFVLSLVTTLVPKAIDVEKALETSGIRSDKREKTNFVGQAGESRTPVAPIIPTFDEKLDAADEFSPTPSDVHATAFEGAITHTKQANAEKEFFSRVGITNAEVRAIDENETDDYIVGGNMNDNSVTEIFIPGVMSMPILIPDGNDADDFEAINRFILNHIRNSSELLTPNDFKELGIDEFSQYNNAKMSEGFLGLPWRNGLGPQPVAPLTQAEREAAGTTTTDTSSY
jgi:hypothetical protein